MVSSVKRFREVKEYIERYLIIIDTVWSLLRFNGDNVRDVVILERHKLRGNNYNKICINDDLTQHRTALANSTRQLKRAKNMTDCWTYNGKVCCEMSSLLPC